ncbi:MAG TPA: CPBP family intramembrane glutamic endopeptidase [Balneolaceae bacterium]|nr:CPBP family intramembrane glutamic endopeptidase [Balneolaceae bacterium]
MIDTSVNSGSYAKETNTLLYSYLLSLPLLLLYEFLIIISQPGQNLIVRISVDSWIKSLFTSIGLDAFSITLFIAALAGLGILYRDRKKLARLNKRYFLYLIIESMVYAILLAFIISYVVQSILLLDASGALSEMSKLQLFALSLGAGLYEELFFRVILISVLVFLISRVLSKKWLAYLVSALIAAFLFSTVHYIGEFGDPFTIGSFLFRFLFGLALNGIYVLRGFGTAAWTHALYDLLVIFMLS